MLLVAAREQLSFNCRMNYKAHFATTFAPALFSYLSHKPLRFIGASPLMLSGDHAHQLFGCLSIL